MSPAIAEAHQQMNRAACRIEEAMEELESALQTLEASPDYRNVRSWRGLTLETWLHDRLESIKRGRLDDAVFELCQDVEHGERNMRRFIAEEQGAAVRAFKGRRAKAA